MFPCKSSEDRSHLQFQVKLPRSPEKPPARAPSPSKHAPVKLDHLQRRRSPSPTKASNNPMQFVSPQVGSPVKTTVTPVSPVKTVDMAPTGGFRSVLASKASGATKSPIKNSTPSGYRAPSPSKEAPTFRSVSPSKVNRLPHQPSLRMNRSSLA